METKNEKRGSKGTQYQQLNRIFRIVNKLLLRRPFSLEDLNDSLDEALEKRTFQRDLKFIENSFGILCKCKRGKYQIIDNEDEALDEERLNALTYFNALQMDTNLQKVLYPEKRQKKGLNNLFPIIQAIKAKKQIKFQYAPFWGDSAYEVVVHPYGLKEFDGRWYLICLNTKYEEVRTYALDRFHDSVEILSTSFKETFDLETAYQHQYGIIKNGKTPENLVLQVDPFQGNYIKTYPWHSSQTIVEDSKDKLVVKLSIEIEFEIKSKILSFGNAIKVLEPQWLADEIKENLMQNWKQYQ